MSSATEKVRDALSIAEVALNVVPDVPGTTIDNKAVAIAGTLVRAIRALLQKGETPEAILKTLTARLDDPAERLDLEKIIDQALAEMEAAEG
ncbi:MAG: hypothetical protein JJ863_21290 [Deltaproteobacteria bacterium]|nr:hypothetical protein [Deltaproteobacteria bacterium]